MKVLARPSLRMDAVSTSTPRCALPSPTMRRSRLALKLPLRPRVWVSSLVSSMLGGRSSLRKTSIRIAIFIVLMPAKATSEFTLTSWPRPISRTKMVAMPGHCSARARSSSCSAPMPGGGADVSTRTRCVSRLSGELNAAMMPGTDSCAASLRPGLPGTKGRVSVGILPLTSGSACAGSGGRSYCAATPFSQVASAPLSSSYCSVTVIGGVTRPIRW